MDTSLSAELKALVLQMVHDVVGDNTGAPHRAVSNADLVPQPTGRLRAENRVRTETVRIAGHTDLQRFALTLLELFENPKSREDLRCGRLTFELAGGVAAPSAPGAVLRVERGAVTERLVATAAAVGQSILLGQRAVLTPLAREKARTLNVPIEKERR